MDDFAERNAGMIRRMAAHVELKDLARRCFDLASTFEYPYHFEWLGRPVIQWPQDLVAMQEIIWKVKPEVIVETGIARGGSLIFSASLLQLIGGPGRVVGVDVDIRAHNRGEIERHPLAGRISLIQGSSTDEGVVEQVRRSTEGARSVLVALDSNHTHVHVLRELELYGPLVTPGSYLVVFDTVIEDMPADAVPDRPWGRGNNPKTAVREYLRTTDRFEIDRDIEAKLLVTTNPDGYLRCVGGSSRSDTRPERGTA
jgi:cephalosporin hydroxylase